jgi:hypothetical protein
MKTDLRLRRRRVLTAGLIAPALVLGPSAQAAAWISVRDCGAVGDGVTNDAPAIRAALLAMPQGGTLFFGPGVYAIEEEIEGTSNAVLKGAGAIFLATRPLRSLFHFSGKTNIRVEDCVFDLNNRDLPTYSNPDLDPQNVGLSFEGCADVEIRRNRFLDLRTNAVRLYNTVGKMAVEENEFRAGQQSQTLLLEHLWFTTVSGEIVICGNSFVNAARTDPATVPGGIFMSGTKGSIRVDGNYFDFCGRDNTGHHRVGVIDCYGNCENVTISNNQSLNTMAIFLRLSASWPAQVFGNTVVRSYHAEPGNTVTVTSYPHYIGVGRGGTQAVSIRDNVMIARGPDNHGIAVCSYDYAVPNRAIEISRNVLVDFKFAIGIGGPFDGVTVAQNKLIGRRGENLIQVLNTGTNVVLSSGYGVSAADGVYRHLLVERNILQITRQDVTPLHLNFASAEPMAEAVGDLVVRDNQIEALRPSPRPAIAAVGGGHKRGGPSNF